MQTKSKRQNRIQRHRRVRGSISGDGIRPRFTIFRSNKHVWAQLIDDSSGKTMVAADDRAFKAKDGPRLARAEKVGAIVAEKALEKKIVMVVFDRGGYKYHGLIKAVAEGARRGGLKF